MNAAKSLCACYFRNWGCGLYYHPNFAYPSDANQKCSHDCKDPSHYWIHGTGLTHSLSLSTEYCKGLTHSPSLSTEYFTGSVLSPTITITAQGRRIPLASNWIHCTGLTHSPSHSTGFTGVTLSLTLSIVAQGLRFPLAITGVIGSMPSPHSQNYCTGLTLPLVSLLES